MVNVVPSQATTRQSDSPHADVLFDGVGNDGELTSAVEEAGYRIDNAGPTHRGRAPSSASARRLPVGIGPPVRRPNSLLFCPYRAATAVNAGAEKCLRSSAAMTRLWIVAGRRGDAVNAESCPDNYVLYGKATCVRGRIEQLPRPMRVISERPRPR